MPVTAGFIDQLREAFGVEQINAAIRGGLAGDGSFYASENGIEIGSRPRELPDKVVKGSDFASSFVRKGGK